MTFGRKGKGVFIPGKVREMSEQRQFSQEQAQAMYAFVERCSESLDGADTTRDYAEEAAKMRDAAVKLLADIDSQREASQS